MKRMCFAAGAMVVMMTAQTARAGNYCGELKNGYGPFDYRERAEHVENFNLVEGAHFTQDVENGIKGNTTTIGGDLDYTLRAIPNHHRALASMARLAARTKSIQLPGAKYPVECYFERALRFAPNDGGVRAEFGNYLYALGKPDKAFVMFRDAAEMSPENPTINYNLGLAYLQRKDYAQSLVYAKKAYALGFPLPGLKNKLIAAGKWDGKTE
jgi:tetratricopeptide (TPR) repeat protein